MRFYAALPVILVWMHFSGPCLWAEDPTAGPLVVVNHAGKEMKVNAWNLTHGTRHLNWLEAGPVKGKKGQAPRGPLCLEFREDQSTTYKEGILTLVPVASLRRIDYQPEKKAVMVTYLGAGDKEATLSGSTKYLGINKLTIEGDADLGDLGAATVKFLGGDPKQGLRSLRFPAAKPVPAPTGHVALIRAQNKEKSPHPVHDLAALYKTQAGYRTLPYLMFKKTVKVELAKIGKMVHLDGPDKKFASFDYEVTLADGATHTLTLLEKIAIDEGPAVLVGLVGRVAAGWQLFPPHTIAEMTWEPAKEKQP